MRTRNFVTVMVLFALAFTPALASGKDEGFFVSVKGKFLQPSAVNSGYVLIDPDDDFDPEGRIQTLDMSSAFSAKISLGQHRSRDAGWVVSYWSFDDDARDRVTSPEDGTLWDILYHADEAFEDFEGFADAVLSIEAKTVDLAYWRRMIKNESSELTWTAGLRSASLENLLSVRYDDETTFEEVDLMSEADGLGLIGGLEGSVAVGRKWRLRSGIHYGFLAGAVESSNLQVEDGSLAEPDVRVRRKEDRTISIVEFGCGLVYGFSDQIELELGYEFSQWDNVFDRDLFPDDIHTGFVQNDATDVTWNGVTLGVTLAF